MNCAVITSTVSTYIDTSAGRRSSSGRLRSDPEFWLGSSGSARASQSTTTTETPAIARKVVRQPIASPSTRPSGMPSTIARMVPLASRPRAFACWPGGATRTASEAVIDQNTAWAKAMPKRLIISTVKFQAKPESTWLTMNRQKITTSRRRRSMLRVSCISGSEASDTTQA